MTSTSLHNAPVPRRTPRRDFKGWLKQNASVVKEAGVRWSDDACYRMGASLAYYAVFSIFPLLLLAVTLLGFFLGADPGNRARILGAVAGVLSPRFRALLDDTLSSMQLHETARGIGAVVGGATLLFGASGVFSELETSFNTIWRVKEDPSADLGTTILHAVRDKAISLGAVVGAGAVLLLSLVASTALDAVSGAGERVIPDPVAWQGLDALVSLGLATLLFAVLFRLLPRCDVAWGDVAGGAFCTALVFAVLKRLFAWYLGHLGSYAAYGAVGAMLGLLTWIYLVSLLVFFGVEITRVYAERSGSLAEHGAAPRASPPSKR